MAEIQMSSTTGGVTSSGSGALSPVPRGINPERVTVLLFIVNIAVTVGFGVGAAWWIDVLAALGSSVLVVLAITMLWRVESARRVVMGALHWMTGQ